MPILNTTSSTLTPYNHSLPHPPHRSNSPPTFDHFPGDFGFYFPVSYLAMGLLQACCLGLFLVAKYQNGSSVVAAIACLILWPLVDLGLIIAGCLCCCICAIAKIRKESHAARREL